MANSPRQTPHSLDAELVQWMDETISKEIWYVEPPHHVPKPKDSIDVAILSHFNYGFSIVALGHLAIYHRINRDPNCRGLADRVFLYDPLDNGNGRLRSDVVLFASLPTFERKLSLNETQLICVSLTNPDAATIALQLMRLGKVPLRAKDRSGKNYPLILAGGPGCCNPEPFADYFDMFCIGDGAELTAKIVEAIYTLKKSGQLATVNGIQRAVKNVSGLYVPSSYCFGYAGTQVTHIEPMNQAPAKVRAAMDPPLEASQCSLVSNGEVAVIVPNYGCKHRCAYCQISEIEYREFSVDLLIKRVRQYISSGIKTLIVNSATLTQHADVENLLSILAEEVKASKEKVKIYVGSMRFDEISADVLSRMSDLEAFSHTYLLYTKGSTASFMALAPEHGSRDLMRCLKRSVDPWNILNTVDLAAVEGIFHFVLYFIVGFESESKGDRDQISSLVCAILDKVNNWGGSIILKINPLIPTPGTACQRMAMPTVAAYHQYVKEVEEGIIRRVGEERFKRQIQVVMLPDDRLYFEAVINRADRRIGPFIENFTSCRNHGIEPDEATLRSWLEAIDLSWDSLIASRSAAELVPWQVVDITSTKAEQQVLSAIRARISL